MRTKKEQKTDRREWLENRLSREMLTASTQMFYSEEVIDHQRYAKGLFNILITALSGGGALYIVADKLYAELTLSSEWSTFISLAFIICTGLVALIGQLSSVFFLNEKDYAKLLLLHSEYLSYLYSLENLYGKTKDKTMNTEEIENQFSELTERYAAQLTEASRLFGRTKPKWEQKAQNRCYKRIDYLEHITKENESTNSEKNEESFSNNKVIQSLKNKTQMNSIEKNIKRRIVIDPNNVSVESSIDPK